MAFRSSGNRNHLKEKNANLVPRFHENELTDEIALRDEIYRLKRQLMALNKANERNVVKVRKYEDEAKRKDKQIEQLMDPVKNVEVRRLLSTKGAALLLNLKEQNNTLLQIILDKDVQIRKLLSKVKTSKLYASSGSRRTECYRTEIDRLRNLLVKSQSMVKAQDSPPRRSVCVGGSPACDLTLSSEQSSPRDLEELQFTVRNLEMHMKYSNELLVKKNEQIMQLQEQLDSIMRANRCSFCRSRISTKHEADSYSRDNECKIANGEEAASLLEEEEEEVMSTTPRDEGDTKPVALLEEASEEAPDPPPPSISRHRESDESGGDAEGNRNCCRLAAEDAGACAAVKCIFEDDPAMLEEEASSKNDDYTANVEVEEDRPGSAGYSSISGAVFFEEVVNDVNNAGSEREVDESDIETAEFEMMEKEIENEREEPEISVKSSPERRKSEEIEEPEISVKSSPERRKSEEIKEPEISVKSSPERRKSDEIDTQEGSTPSTRSHMKDENSRGSQEQVNEVSAEENAGSSSQTMGNVIVSDESKPDLDPEKTDSISLRDDTEKECFEEQKVHDGEEAVTITDCDSSSDSQSGEFILGEVKIIRVEAEINPSLTRLDRKCRETESDTSSTRMVNCNGCGGADSEDDDDDDDDDDDVVIGS